MTTHPFYLECAAIMIFADEPLCLAQLIDVLAEA